MNDESAYAFAAEGRAVITEESVRVKFEEDGRTLHTYWIECSVNGKDAGTTYTAGEWQASALRRHLKNFVTAAQFTDDLSWRVAHMAGSCPACLNKEQPR